ncbi:MAG: hypothetical protein U1F57_12240 [bacterium]
MGLFDLLCPPPNSRVPESFSSDAALYSEGAACQNCHREIPEVPVCPAAEAWPSSLSRPLRALQTHPESLRWWVDENHLRTQMRQRDRRGDFPVLLSEHDLRVQVDPIENNIPGLSAIMNAESRINLHLRGNGLDLSLNQNPLVSISPASLLGSLSVYFDEGSFTSDSWLANWFVSPRNAVLALIPVAYDPQDGTLYNLRDYLRQYFSYRPCGAFTENPEALGTPLLDGGAPIRESSMDGGGWREDPGVVQDMTHAAMGSDLGTGIWDAGCFSEPPALPVRLPYLFHYALDFILGRPGSGHLDLQRLYREILRIRALPRPAQPASSASVDFFSSAQVDWTLRPERVSLENFLLEFSQDQPSIPLRVVAGPHELQSVSVETDLRLDRLFIPGFLHLGPTRAHLQALGPRLNLSLQDLDAQIEPFDVGQEDPSHRGPFHIAGGSLVDGEAYTEGPETVPPGFHLEGAMNESLRYSANLRISLNLETPEGRAFRLSGHLIASGTLVPTESGLGPEVGTTRILLQEIRLEPLVPSRGDSGFSFLNGAQVSIHDLPPPGSRAPTGFQVQVITPALEAASYRGGQVEFFVPLSAYDPATETYFSEMEFSWFGPPRGAYYRPDLSFSDFGTELFFHLDGGRTVSDANGSLSFRTRALDENTRSYEALFNADRFSWSLPAGLSLLLEEIHGRFAFERQVSEPGVCDFQASAFQVEANGGSAQRGGILPGSMRVSSTARDGILFGATYSSADHRLDVRRFGLQFLFSRIAVPALIDASRESAASRPQVGSIQLDGRLGGRWSMDTRSGAGRGQFCLLGDSQDVMLRDSRGRLVPDPLVADTRWCVSSIHRVDAAHGVLWGNFLLDTTVDWGLLRYFGIHLNMRARGRMSHNNFPYSGQGYGFVERLFFGNLLEERRRELEGPRAPSSGRTP